MRVTVPRASALRAARPRGVPTFAQALETVIAIHAENWKDRSSSEHQWRATLSTYAFPRIGSKRVDEVTTADVMAILTPIWSSKHVTVKRIRQRIGAVMKWAVAQGHRADNPAGDALGAALPKNGAAPRHQRALPHAEVGPALRRIRVADAHVGIRLAFEFLVLTAARSGEVRGARWDEIDREGAVWTIPGERMRAGREHRVPLADCALAVLNEARELSDAGGIVLPSPRGLVLHQATLAGLARDLKIGSRAARVPVQLPGLGRGVHGRARRGVRDRAGPRQHRPRGSGLPPHRPVRPAPPVDGRAGGLRRLRQRQIRRSRVKGRQGSPLAPGAHP